MHKIITVITRTVFKKFKENFYANSDNNKINFVNFKRNKVVTKAVVHVLIFYVDTCCKICINSNRIIIIILKF